MDLTPLADIMKSSVERAPWGWALLATTILALIKVWPVLTKLGIEARAAMRVERRADLSDCQARLDAMSIRLDLSEAKHHSFELKLVGTLTAYRILDVEIASRFPESLALIQARAVLNDAFTVSPSTPADMEQAVRSVP
jgi:hypothetical protein